MNFRQLDLNLLRVLCAVHRTGSVTEAGRQLALSQPATSNALARLRRWFGDELFVRSSAGLRPTRLTERIVPMVAAHLGGLESSLCSGEAFDPAHSGIHWRLSLSDLGEMMFMPPLAQVLRSESPNCQVTNVAVDAKLVGAALDSREVDLAIGLLLPEHAGIASESLFQERFVALTGSRWRPGVGRAGKGLSTEQLTRAALVVAAPAATSHASVDLMLTRLKLQDRAVVRARHYSALPELVTCTDLMAIVPLMYANAVATRYDVRMWELPGHGLHYNVRMLWHQSAAGDPAHGWLRERVRRLFARPDGG